MSGSLKLFLIAGEPSGDRLGAALMAGLKSLTQVEFTGVGGPLMQAEGLVRSKNDLAVVLVAAGSGALMGRHAREVIVLIINLGI